MLCYFVLPFCAFNSDLSAQNLAGSISSEIGCLTDLISLNLSHNALTGSLPDELCSLSSLRSLDVSFNGLHGALPSNFSRLPLLQCRLRYIGDVALISGNDGIVTPISDEPSSTPSDGGTTTVQQGCVATIVFQQTMCSLDVIAVRDNLAAVGGTSPLDLVVLSTSCTADNSELRLFIFNDDFSTRSAGDVISSWVNASSTELAARSIATSASVTASNCVSITAEDLAQQIVASQSTAPDWSTSTTVAIPSIATTPSPVKIVLVFCNVKSLLIFALQIQTIPMPVITTSPVSTSPGATTPVRRNRCARLCVIVSVCCVWWVDVCLVCLVCCVCCVLRVSVYIV